MLGFCNTLVKPFGPDQLYVPPPPPVKLNVFAAQMGELLVRLGDGEAMTLTFATAVLVQLPTEVVTVKL